MMLIMYRSVAHVPAKGGGDCYSFPVLLLRRCHYFVLDTWMMVILGAQRGSTPLGYKSSGIRTGTYIGGNQKMYNIRVTENRCYLTSCIRCLSSISLLKVWQTAAAATLRSINIVLFVSTDTNTNEIYYFPKSIDCPQKIVFR